ncbi:MAG: hypothetical protein ABJN69_10735 [Hellea sp.]
MHDFNIVIIEDTASRVDELINAIKLTSVEMQLDIDNIDVIWLRHDSDYDPNSPAPPIESLLEGFKDYKVTSDPRKSVNFISNYINNTLVFIDRLLGNEVPSEIYELLNKKIQECQDTQNTIFVQAYSASISYKNAQVFINSSEACDAVRWEESEGFAENLIKVGLENWEKLRESSKPASIKRLWPKGSERYFLDEKSTITHNIPSDLTEYRTELLNYWENAFLKNDKTTEWFLPPYSSLRERNWFSFFSHEALKSVVGNDSAAHLGYKHENKETVASMNGSKELTLGAIIILLAIATAPNNRWLGEFKWEENPILNSAITDGQTPKQAYESVNSLIGTDIHKIGRKGLFTTIRVLDDRPNQDAVNSVTLIDSGIRIELNFGLSELKRGGRRSLLRYLKYETPFDEGGEFTNALKHVVDCFGRTRVGIFPVMTVNLRPHGSETSKCFLEFISINSRDSF